VPPYPPALERRIQHPELREEDRKLLTDDEFRRELIERSSREWERMANMDWQAPWS
jgi:hypothetical protein